MKAASERLCDRHQSGRILMAWIFAARMGLFQTHDGGETWQDMEVGRFLPTTYGGRDINGGR